VRNAVYSVRYCTESDGAVTDMTGVAALTGCLLLLVTQFAILTIPVLINALLKPQKVRIPTGQETFLISKLTPGSVADEPSCSSMVTRVFPGGGKGSEVGHCLPLPSSLRLIGIIPPIHLNIFMAYMRKLYFYLISMYFCISILT
jgi:hypothetical protein